MPFITAPQIHNGLGWLPEGTTIEVSSNGTILGITSTPPPGTLNYDGILCPGFINAHCHLELSHMKGVVPEHTGLMPFLMRIPKHRNDATEAQKLQARHSALQELVDNGVVAVGDIVNTSDTFDLRAKDQLHFHSFVETIGFTGSRAPIAMQYSENTISAFRQQVPLTHTLRQSIVPHAPYSVSPQLFSLISSHQPGALLSIHNQESTEENTYYISKEGSVSSLLRSLGIDESSFTPTGKPSLPSYLPFITPDHPMIFVHNTISQASDIRFANAHLAEAYWCLCPNANLYIENNLPDVPMLMAEGATICIGTDSLASNHQLSVLSELITLKNHFPKVSWETLITWATANGAKALQMDKLVGTIEPGMQPGILLLIGLHDPKNNPLVKRLY